MYNDRDYTEYLDSLGDPMPWTSQATYTEGDEIVIKHTYNDFTPCFRKLWLFQQCVIVLIFDYNLLIWLVKTV